MTPDLAPLLAAALDITETASRIATGHFQRALQVDLKADASPVTIADRETEAAIRQALTARFPEFGIYGEEYGAEGLERDKIWVVDPIDGTKSFIFGVPLFGMLLALAVQGQPVLGVIRMPQLDDVYAGARGLGATRNGRAIRTSGVRHLSEAALFINEGDKIFAAEPAVFARLVTAGRMRRLAYDCHPHALLAEGRIDAVVDHDLKPYDYMALAGVIEAAGGVISDWEGQPVGFGSDGRVVSAATPELHAELLALLAAG